MAPMVAGGSSQSWVRMGKKAASVLPAAVLAESSRWQSVSKIASQAATCTPRRDFHSLL